jgi:hypothetical protein
MLELGLVTAAQLSAGVWLASGQLYMKGQRYITDDDKVLVPIYAKGNLP